ncbi:hypothetical protein SASPL_147959 [Salvia splendens]|uniref:CAP-Gly domain-containing protein n=1 Tax=Salvia splendens TaxID=180675 RepID=A0A8X8Z3X7_SALSN|nr:hypothetical protein SASPL_147959 [Salvia splendens]
MQTSSDLTRKTDSFRVGQRVHFAGQPRRVGTVRYVGPVEGYGGDWVGVYWDADGQGKHDGSHNGMRCMSFLQEIKKVTIELLGKHQIEDKFSRFEELATASLSYLGVSFPGPRDKISSTLPNLKELDLTGNLLSHWNDISIICEGLPALTALNLSNDSMSPVILCMPQLSNIRLYNTDTPPCCRITYRIHIRILVLNQTGVLWDQMEALKDALTQVEELHLMGNHLRKITPMSSDFVQGFDTLRLLNLDNNCISTWDEIVKFSQLHRLEQLFLNNNNLNCISYPDCGKLDQLSNECGNGSQERSSVPFKSLRSLYLGGNNIEDLPSLDSLNSFPNLMVSITFLDNISLKDIRFSGNPVADVGKGGVARFVIIARIAKMGLLNGSEVGPQERKDSEIRYVRLVMSKCNGDLDEIRRLHPRFYELKKIHGLDDERPTTEASGPQKMASGLISITLKCVGASMGEKTPLVKKLPSTATVGKLKNLCLSFFKLKSVKPILFLEEEGSPLPILLEDDMATLVELGVGNDSTILVDELS